MDFVSFSLGLLHVILWMCLIGGFFLLMANKKYRQTAITNISISIIGLWAWPFISSFLKGPSPNASVEDNLSMLAAKSPFYGIFSRLPDWALNSIFMLLIVIIALVLMNSQKRPKSGKDSK